jgi:uncharacterized membrane protein YidH (DUF202 family)
MTVQRIAGVILLVLGFVVLLAGGISWNQTKTIVDIGPLQATTQERKTLPMSPLLGVIALVGGIALCVSVQLGTPIIRVRLWHFAA